MEGDECYKLSTIRRFIEATDAAPIRLAVDIGCNVGDVSALIRFYFPLSQVFAFEPVEEYYRIAVRRLAADPLVKVIQAAVCGLHCFEDDLGQLPRNAREKMKIMKGREGAGPGWRGGSMVVPEGHHSLDPTRYANVPQHVQCLDLDSVVDAVTTLSGRDEIDYVKFDCEGCECDAIGCASPESLRRIRFISGEYHDLSRFARVVPKIQRSHRVNLVGDAWGGFFCERINAGDSLLMVSATQFALTDQSGSIQHHRFREEFVPFHSRASHGM